MSGFGSLAPGAFPAVDPMAPEAYAQEDWRDREAAAALAAQKHAGPSWYDTLNDVAHFPHRMFGALTSSPASPEADQQAMMPETFQNPLVKNLAGSLGEAIHSGATAPGDALSGKLPMTDAEGHTSMEAVKRAFDTASIAGGGSVAGTAERAIKAPSELAAPYHAALDGAAPALLSDSAKPGAVIAAAEHAPTFNTAAEPALERIARKNGTPEQWRNDLAKYGVTKEEMATRGLDDLKPGQPFSKDQIAAHFEKNPVDLKPVNKQSMPEDWHALTGDQQYAVADKFRDVTGREPMNGHVLQDWYEKIQQHSADGSETALDGIFNPPRYADYQLPGGANYRERLLTLPEKEVPMRFKVAKDADGGSKMTRADSENFRGPHWSEPNVVVHRRSTDRVMDATPISEIESKVQATQPAGSSLDHFASGAPEKMVRDGVLTSQEAADWARANNWHSSKLYDKPGTGKRTLHDEEQQSDWHQAGAKQGYGKGQQQGRVEPQEGGTFKVVWPDGTFSGGYSESAARITAKQGGKPGVPDGPFKDSWHRLALHDQIREAADKGYDRISWTGGRSSPTNPKNLGQTSSEAEKASNGLIKHYDEKLVNTANKIGKAHGVQVQKGGLRDNGPISGSKAMDRMTGARGWEDIPAREEGRGEWFSNLDHDRREQLFEDARNNGHDIYHMDVPQSLKDQALKKGFSMFEDSGKAGGIVSAAEHMRPGPENPGVGVPAGNAQGFVPELRVKANPTEPLPPKPLFTQTTNNKNAVRQIDNIDPVLAAHPNATESVDNWSNMMAHAFATDDVPIPPYALIKDIAGDAQGAIDKIKSLSKGQIEDANHGFENAREFRRAYENKELSVETTGKLFLWSFLSRGVSPYTQEGLFIDSFKGIDPWIRKAAEGKLTQADMPEYKAWASTAAPKGSGQPGAGAAHNLNAFGELFLTKMGERGEDGLSHLQRIHDMMSNPEMTGQQIRREFMKVGEGVGIDNKVVSFTMLVAGYKDMMVIDRVQTRQLFDDGRFAGKNIYDGQKNAEGKVITGTPLANLTYGARGLLVYEAIERGLQNKIAEIYKAAGRPKDASVGRYHWESWVAHSQQEASHGTLGAILSEAKGSNAPLAGVAAKQGEYGAYEYGAKYARDHEGKPFYSYTVPSGKEYSFTVPAFRSFLEEIKKPSTGVVPTKFKVTEAGNAPWFKNPKVNTELLEQRAQHWSDRSAGGERAEPVLPSRPSKGVPDRPGRRPDAKRVKGFGSLSPGAE